MEFFWYSYSLPLLTFNRFVYQLTAKTKNYIMVAIYRLVVLGVQCSVFVARAPNAQLFQMHL